MVHVSDKLELLIRWLNDGTAEQKVVHVSDKLELLFKAYSKPETEAAPSTGNNTDDSVAGVESSQTSLYDVSAYFLS